MLPKKKKKIEADFWKLNIFYKNNFIIGNNLINKELLQYRQHRAVHGGLLWRAWKFQERRQKTPINLNIEKALHLNISLTEGFLFFIWTQHSKFIEQIEM